MTITEGAASRLLWKPAAARIEQAPITRFARSVAPDHPEVERSYEDLWRWSVDDLEGFWAAVWRFFDVQADGNPERVRASRQMPHAEWFPDVQLNFAEHVFRDRQGSAVALQHASELRELETWTWAELRGCTARIASGLRRLGVGKGDRVAAYLPNIPEAVAAFLACASIGAVWSSCSPDFGPRSVVDGFAQIEPKVLLAVDGYRYGGKDFDRREVVGSLQAAMPGLEQTVLLQHLGCGRLDGTLDWDDFMREHDGLTVVRVPFEHPLWVLYSSGTTGLPKAIVQGHGGILLEHLKVTHFHLDARDGDRVFWFTTTGWMMWNLLVGVLLTPASIVLYDGNPAHPGDDVLWDLAERAGITTFGTSASFVASCRTRGVQPRKGRRLADLRAVGSTGSPLAPEDFGWLYDQLDPDLWLFSTSGGTDVCTAFVGGVPTLPVYEGELQAPALGASLESWDDEGRPLRGQVGELVLTAPMHAMMEPEQMLEHARAAEAAGAHRFCMVTQGQGLTKRDFEKVLEGARLVAEHTNLKRCASVGHMSVARAKQLKDAGIQRVHHNVETSESYYPEVSSTVRYEGRLRTIQAVEEAGLETCVGGILNLGETEEQRVEMAFELAKINPTSVPINLLNPRPGTKFGDRNYMDPWDVVKWVAIFRLVLPEALFRLCGGRVENLGDLQPLAVKAGLNGVMMGNFLTTLGSTPEEDRALFSELGLNVARQPDNGANPRPDNRDGWLDGETPDVVEEYVTTADVGDALNIELWDPSTQLRYTQKKVVPPRPDGAPNRGG